MAEIPTIPPWWGYHKTHGWLVIDRTIPPNMSGLNQDFLFFRCRDSMTFVDRRSRWAAPLYIYASTYIASLEAAESIAAAQELKNLKSRWPEFQAEILLQYNAMVAESRQLEEKRVATEQARLEGLKKTKLKPAKANKQAGTAPAIDA